MNQEIKILKLSNDLINIEMVIKCVEHDRLNIIGNGDPVIDDEELLNLNHLQRKIMFLKDEHNEKAAELLGMKKAYYQNLSKELNCPIKSE